MRVHFHMKQKEVDLGFKGFENDENQPVRLV